MVFRGSLDSRLSGLGKFIAGSVAGVMLFGSAAYAKINGQDIQFSENKSAKQQYEESDKRFYENRNPNATIEETIQDIERNPQSIDSGVFFHLDLSPGIPANDRLEDMTQYWAKAFDGLSSLPKNIVTFNKNGHMYGDDTALGFDGTKWHYAERIGTTAEGLPEFEYRGEWENPFESLTTAELSSRLEGTTKPIINFTPKDMSAAARFNIQDKLLTALYQHTDGEVYAYVWDLIENKLFDIYDESVLGSLLDGVSNIDELTYYAGPRDNPLDLVAIARGPNGWMSVPTVATSDGLREVNHLGNLYKFLYMGAEFPFDPSFFNCMGTGDGYSDTIVLIKSAADGNIKNLFTNHNVIDGDIYILNDKNEVIEVVHPDGIGNFRFLDHGSYIHTINASSILNSTTINYYNGGFNIAPGSANLFVIPSNEEFLSKYYNDVFRRYGSLQKFEDLHTIFIDTRTQHVASGSIPSQWLTWANDAADIIKVKHENSPNIQIKEGDFSSQFLHDYTPGTTTYERPNFGVCWYYFNDSIGITGAHSELGPDTNTNLGTSGKVYSSVVIMGTRIPAEWHPGIALAELVQACLGARQDPDLGTDSILDPDWLINRNYLSDLDEKGIIVMKNRQTGQTSYFVELDGNMYEIQDADPKNPITASYLAQQFEKPEGSNIYLNKTTAKEIKKEKQAKESDLENKVKSKHEVKIFFLDNNGNYQQMAANDYNYDEEKQFNQEVKTNNEEMIKDKYELKIRQIPGFKKIKVTLDEVTIKKAVNYD